MLVANIAIRLELAMTAGENPIYVNNGVMTIPPPTPISEPMIPDPNPIMTRIMNSSIKLLFLYLDFHKVDKLKFILLVGDIRQCFVQLLTNNLSSRFKKLSFWSHLKENSSNTFDYKI